MNLKSLFRNLYLLLGIIFLLSTCSPIRKHTYPENFHYLEPKDLSSGMWKFAIGVANLNTLLSHMPSGDHPKQMEVVEQLKELEKIASSLGGGGQTTNHPMLDNHIDLFREDLAQARTAAERTKPNYYLAGRISGSCQYCHGPSPYPHRNQAQ